MRLVWLLRRGLKRVAVLALVGALALGVLVGSLWLEHRSDATLPKPTGPFAIGREIQDWTDDATVDTLAPIPAVKRELLVWIWYPAASGQSPVVDDYLPLQLRPKAEASHANIWTLLTRDVSNVRGHSLRDPDVSPQRRSYPVVIMRAGASASVLNYSTLAEDLASHGYVVVGFDAPYRTARVVFPDGRTIYRAEQNNPEGCLLPDKARMEQCVSRVMSAWTSDIAFVLDRLTQLNASDPSAKFAARLDMTRVGVFGHSLGGAVAAQFCQEDSRCKAGINIDGAPHGSVIQAGLRQPFMFLVGDHSKEAASAEVEEDLRAMYDRIPPDRRSWVVIRGAFHFMFSDDGAVMKSSLVRGVLRVLGRLGMSGRRQLGVTAYCIHSFFDAYLKGSGSSQLRFEPSPYLEIKVLE